MKEQGEFVLMKPHHLLDIIKLYGAGYEIFVPDEAYGHDFWRIGNTILQDPNVRLRLTMGSDAICAPCKFCNGKECVDVTTTGSGEISKEDWNKLIDKRLLELLKLEECVVLSAMELCCVAQDRLSEHDMCNVWKEKPAEETKKRAQMLMAGLEKYLAKYQ